MRNRSTKNGRYPVEPLASAPHEMLTVPTTAPNATPSQIVRTALGRTEQRTPPASARVITKSSLADTRPRTRPFEVEHDRNVPSNGRSRRYTITRDLTWRGSAKRIAISAFRSRRSSCGLRLTSSAMPPAVRSGEPPRQRRPQHRHRAWKQVDEPNPRTHRGRSARVHLRWLPRLHDAAFDFPSTRRAQRSSRPQKASSAGAEAFPSVRLQRPGIARE